MSGAAAATAPGSIWKALADPTRRAILDLLHERPRTTGELAAEFPASRFAVMKHLGVLVEANLVVARRRGRERWNHLNAMPLQRLYERWVSRYAGARAAGLSRLKDHLEGKGKAMDQTKKDKFLDVHELELEIAIEAPREAVWKGLAEDLALWWPRDFAFGPMKKMVLEAKPGGRMYEDWGDGQGMVWATVVLIDAPKRMYFVGHLVPEASGGSCGTTMLRITLEGEGSKTLLKLADTVSGRLDPGIGESLRSGYKLLYEEAFKSYVERGVRA